MIANNHPASPIRRNGVSSAEIERAIHLDVEGFLDVETGSPPVMASVLVDGRTETFVFEDRSLELAEAARATGFPHPRPRFAPSGTLARSSRE